MMRGKMSILLNILMRDTSYAVHSHDMFYVCRRTFCKFSGQNHFETRRRYVIAIYI